MRGAGESNPGPSEARQVLCQWPHPSCLNYFSTAVTKHHDQGNSESMTVRVENTAAGKQAWRCSLTSDPQGGGRELTGNGVGYPPTMPHLLILPKWLVLPSGDQVFKHTGL